MSAYRDGTASAQRVASDNGFRCAGKGYEVKEDMKILAVCGMGLGSSMVLKLTLGKVLKQLSLKADVEVSDIGSAHSQQADLIVTSAELAERLTGTHIPVIVIKNYVDQKEMKDKLLAVLDHAKQGG